MTSSPKADLRPRRPYRQLLHHSPEHGRPAGAAALAERLGDRLAMRGEPPEDAVLLRRDLTALLSLQRSTTTRDILLAAADAHQLRGWLTACQSRLPGGTPGCVLVVADLLTDGPEEEALMVLREPSPRIRVNSAAICSGKTRTALANC